MTDELAQQVAASLETTPELLPLLPELLADIQELGSSPRDVVDILRPLGLPPTGTRALDLGCGKGAIAIALARELACEVVGVDAVGAFVEEAERRAGAAGVSALCRFRRGDLRDALRSAEPVDVLVYASVGPVLGNVEQTVGELRRAVRPSGYLVIDDAFLADETTASPVGYEDYASHEETVRRLTAHGDTLLKEVLEPAEDVRAVNLRNTALIRRRAERLAKRHPESARLIHEYVETQERETRVQGTSVVGATWLLQRA